MSTLPENELDLEKLFLPAWAQEPASAKHYAQYETRDDRRESRYENRGDKGGRRPPRRDGPSPGGPRENRPRGDRGPKGGGEKRSFGQRSFGQRREEPRQKFEAPQPLPEIAVAFIPDEKGVESLARQIKMTGRAYPLFDIARLILDKPERHSVTFSVKKNAEGKIAQPLFVCALDETLWLSEDAAIAHVLKNHFATFYQIERTATEPPKGKYTFVAQCGMSGVILGPPNYHDYQNQLRKLHTERFSRLPFEVFKARVKIVRDEEVVKKWIDDQSWKTEFTCLNMPEPLRLGSREAVEKHFRETHKEAIIKPVESYNLPGATARALRNPELMRLLRQSWEDQRRFPLQLATALSQQFASHGLQFFKVNKTVTHVSVARPHFLDLEITPVSEGVKRIVEFVNTHPKTTRRKLVEALAPSAPKTPAPAAQSNPPIEGETPVANPPASDEPTSEQTAVVSDLHWLIHQGHVIEFANGVIETAKKPAPKPPKPEPKRAPENAPAQAASQAAPETSVEPAANAESPVTPEQSSEESAAVEPEAITSEAAPAAELPKAEPTQTSADVAPTEDSSASAPAETQS
jgi:hypothetical protein